MANVEKLEKALEPYIKAAQKVGGRGGGGRAPSAYRSQLQAIREWGKSRGFKVSERGRVSKELRDAYEAAQP